VSTAANGLAFDSSGALYMVNYDGSYYTVDTLSGAATFVDSFGQTAHHGKFYPGTSLYYGIDQAGSFNPRNILVGDVTTGVLVQSLPTVDNLHTLAFVEPIPEPGTLLLLGSGLLGLATRRRRPS
jgi:hypothetical protein